MERAADPYVDTSVIDARAPRFNQAVVGLLSLVAVTTGPWWLLALLALQLAIGLTFGRRWCLPCLAYFELVQPRFGEGQLEDSRPPRFANLVGVVFLSAASLAFAGGQDGGRHGPRRDRGRARAARREHGPVRRVRGLQARLPGHGQALRLLPAPAAAGAERALALAAS